MKTLKTLHQYLTQELTEGKTSFSLTPILNQDKTISFSINPIGKSGDTRDYIVTSGNKLKVLKHKVVAATPKP